MTTGMRELSRTGRAGGRVKGGNHVTTGMRELSRTGTAGRRARRDRGADQSQSYAWLRLIQVKYCTIPV
jgi:hypothetical protein